MIYYRLLASGPRWYCVTVSLFHVWRSPSFFFGAIIDALFGIGDAGLGGRIDDHRFLPLQLSSQLFAFQDADLDACFGLQGGGKSLEGGLPKDGRLPQGAAQHDKGRAELFSRRNQLRP
jgi:hypothetical protein